MNSPSLLEGIVLETSDPQQMGRIKVWCPSLDGDLKYIDVENLPWVVYMSPLAGQTQDYPAGSSNTATYGLTSYGFWAIPKIGAMVVVGLLYDDPACRFYMGSYFGNFGNRSLPQGRNRPDKAKGPVSDTFDPIEPATSNLNAQFGGSLDVSEAQTRGVYERQAGQDKDVRDGAEGYQKGVVEAGLDSQMYCLTTPGRHAIIFQDNPATARVRLKTAEGHQVILDDANERIYVSVAGGKSWIEMDKDGHVHMYGASSVSVSAGEDINFSAGGKINFNAGGDINLAAAGALKGSACEGLQLSGDVVNIETTTTFDILAVAALTLTGAVINMNGPPAKPAECADEPTVVPDHEPWTRPATKGKRGANWKA